MGKIFKKTFFLMEPTVYSELVLEYLSTQNIKPHVISPEEDAAILSRFPNEEERRKSSVKAKRQSKEWIAVKSSILEKGIDMMKYEKTRKSGSSSKRVSKEWIADRSNAMEKAVDLV